MGVLPVCVPLVCLAPTETRVGVTFLGTVVSLHVSAENQSWVLWKDPLSHLSQDNGSFFFKQICSESRIL